MGVDNQFEPLASGEVLSVNESAQILIGHRTFRVEELAEAIRIQLADKASGWTSDKNAWFSQEGISCEVLRFSARGWQKGKVRINLEFCPYEPGDEHQNASAAVNVPTLVNEIVHEEIIILTPPPSEEEEDELDLLGESDTGIEDELDLGESDTGIEDELDLGEFDTGIEDELNLGTSSTFIDDELDLGMSSISTEMDDDEFELGTSLANDEPLEQEAPTEIYSEMEREAAIFDDDDELNISDTSTSLDDEFDEISQSIEDELEMEEEPITSEDELLDLGEISLDNDDDLNFGEIPTSSDDDFQFGDFSTNNELEDDEADSLLDDVWQDMNQPSWQNNH